MVLEAEVVDDVAESFLTDVAFADVGVAVDARTEGGLGIVQVKGEDLFEAKERAGGFDGSVPAFGGADVVTHGEEMGRVEADPEALGPFHTVKNGGEVLDPVSEAQ
jgi:hypothetical protein